MEQFVYTQRFRIKLTILICAVVLLGNLFFHVQHALGLEIADSSIKGKISAEFRDNSEGIKVFLYNQNNNLISTGFTNVSGDFEFNSITPGTYKIKTEKLSHYLATEKKEIVVMSNQIINIGDLIIPFGDIDNNGAIDLFDLIKIAKNYGMISPQDETSEESSLIADPGMNKVVFKSFEIILDGSNSIASEGKTLEYNWRFISKPEGSTVELINSNLVKPSFLADKIGNYVIGLTVSDGVNMSTEKTVEVKVKTFGSTTDDVDTSVIGGGKSISSDLDMSNFIPLSDGWIITKEPQTSKIVILNTLSDERGKEFVLNAVPDKLEFDFEREYLYVSLKEFNKIAQINVNTNEVIYISIDGPAKEIAFGENGILFAMVANSNIKTIQVIDTEQLKVVSSIGYGDFDYLVYDKILNNLMLGESGTSPSSLARYSFDETTFTLKKMQEVWDLGGNGQDLSISEDGKHVAFSCGGGNGTGYTLFDIDSTDITKKFGEWNTGAYPRSATFTLDNRSIVTSNGSKIRIFDVENHYMIREFDRKSSESYDKVRLSRGGKIVYNYTSGTLWSYQSLIDQLPVSNSQPYIEPIAVSSGDRITFPGFTVHFDGTNSRMGTGTSLSYKWEIVSKPENSQTEMINKNLAVPYFIPDIVGDYQVSFVVNNGISDSGEKIINVRVKDFSSSEDELTFSSIENVQNHYVEGYVVKKPIPLTDGWLITADNTNKLKIINVITGETGKEYQLSATPKSIDFDFEKKVVVSSFSGANKIAVIDLNSDLVSYIDVPYRYEGVVFGNNNVVFAISGGWPNNYVSIIDITQKEVLSSKEVSVYGAGLMAYNRNTNNLYLAEKGLSPSSLFRYSYNEISKDLIKEQELDLGSNGLDLALSPDGKHIAFSCGGGNGGYTVFDVDSSDITKSFGEWFTDAYPTAAAFSSDNRFIITSNGSKLKLFDVENHFLLTSLSRTGSTGDYEKVSLSRGSKIIYEIAANKIYFYKNSYLEHWQ